jgi:glyoxalase family protein
MKNNPTHNIIPGIHHITAITNSANENLKFYTEVLGLHLVKKTVNFNDPHGLSLELVATHRLPDVSGWDKGPIPQEHFIPGFHSATATLNARTKTATLLTDVLGMRKIAAKDNRTRFQMNGGTSPGAYYDIVEDPHARVGRMGSGSVHHIAFRTFNGADQEKWRQAVTAHGLNVTPIIDRKYFRSIYFRESGGVLFEYRNMREKLNGSSTCR